MGRPTTRADDETPARTSVFDRPERRGRGPTPGRTRAEIVAAAVALADAEGLAAVSMRSVAAALGTAAPSLYRYVSSRDDLLDLMSDAAAAELGPFVAASAVDDRSEAWVDAVLGLGRDQLDLHRRHPWLVDLTGRSSGVGPSSLAFFDACLRALDPVDAPVRAKFEAVAVMTGLVVLVARSEQAPQDSPFAGRDLAAYPHLATALATAPEPEPTEDLFGRALRSLLVGLLTPGTND